MPQWIQTEKSKETDERIHELLQLSALAINLASKHYEGGFIPLSSETLDHFTTVAIHTLVALGVKRALLEEVWGWCTESNPQSYLDYFERIASRNPCTPEGS